MTINSDFPNIYWHQKWEISPGVFTPGVHDINTLADRLHLPLDLTGQRILDIGSWNGALSLDCARRGAEFVLGIGPEDPEASGFNYLKKRTGFMNVQYQLGSTYDLSKLNLGKFDTVLFCGVLYHLRYPILALDQIASVCSGDLYIETEIDESLAIGTPLWKFHRLNDLNADYSNWFTPNSTAVVEATQSAGFSLAEAPGIFGTRGTFHFKKNPGLPEWRVLPTGEGTYYDILVRSLFE